MNQQKKAIFATLLAALLFATSATSRELSGVQSSSLAIATLRLAIGALGLVVFTKIFVPQFRFSSLIKSPVIWVMGLGVAGYQAFFFIGTGLTGVAVGTLSSLALAPLMAGLISWAWQGLKPSVVWWQSTLIAVIGLIVLSWSGLTESTINLLGVAASVAAGAAYATFTVVGARLAKNNQPAVGVLATSFTIGAVGLLIVSGFQVAESLSGNGIWLALWLGLGATTLAYVLFGVGLTSLPAGTVATLNLAEPLAATFLGLVVLHESISTLSAIGCTLIAVSLWILAVNTAKESGA